MVTPADHDYIRRDSGPAGACFIAEQLELGNVRSDEGQSCLAAGLGKVGALSEEAIARMYRVTASSVRDLDNCLAIQVSSRTGAWQRPNLVCHTQVQTARIVLRMHANSGQAQVGRRARDANGDLAAVGDQQLGHGHAKISNNNEDEQPAVCAANDHDRRCRRYGNGLAIAAWACRPLRPGAVGQPPANLSALAGMSIAWAGGERSNAIAATLRRRVGI